MSHTTDSLLTELRALWRGLVRMLGDSYRPERHYMRGLGPKSRIALSHAQLQPVPVRIRGRGRVG